MPYKIVEDGDKFCVHKVNADDSLGELVKCHDTKDDAEAHLRALYANVEDAKKGHIQPFVTLKQTDGALRWILFSSSSYEDRDGEIISQKALEEDTERMNRTGQFGTLDWWHTPIVLGDCDFSAMHGRISVESGTFRDQDIGEAIARAAKSLGASRTFLHPITQPDAHRVYHNIRTVSRAILPAEYASNVLTLVEVAKENPMLEDKIKKLKELLGGTPEAEAKVDALLQSAEQLDKAAQDAGLVSKEAITPSDSASMDKDDKRAWFVADMTPEEFDQRLRAAVEQFLTPAVKALGEQIAAMNEAQAKTVKEHNDNLLAQIKAMQDANTTLAARLAALEGLTPRAYRATQDPQTAVDAQTVKEKTPRPSQQAIETLASWLSGM